MQDSNLPSQKYTTLWASAAAAGDVTAPIPTVAQPGGLVSLPTGFTEVNFTPVAAGGVPPWGKDFNGIFKLITAWQQWQQAGGSIPYDATFQTAVGGYPKNAIVASATTSARWWLSTADNNVTNPDTGGAGWVPYPFAIPLAVALGGTNKTSYTLGSVLFYDGTRIGEDNPNFYWNDSLVRLGLGTNAPNAMLDVRGTIAASGTITTTSPSAGGALSAPNGGLTVGNTATIGSSLIAGGIVQSNSGSPIAIFAPNGSLEIGGNGVFGAALTVATAGNFGGTVTTGGSFEVNTTAHAAGVGIVASEPVVELQNGGGGNTWVYAHNDDAALHWSFNTIGRMELDQSGNLTIQGSYSPSDVALKENVSSLDTVIERVKRLRPVTFNYREFPNRPSLGFVAQELQCVFPELVKRGSDGLLSVDYARLSTVALAAIIELIGRH